MSSDLNWFERRGVLLAFLLPIAIVVFTFTELRYLTFGETVQGSIVSVDAIEGERGKDMTVIAHDLRVEYVDPTDNQSATVVARMGSMWQPEGDTISIQYIPGHTESGRLASDQHPWIAVSILIAAVLLTLFVIKAVRDMNRPIRR
ncbi:hypothetical protein Pan258_58580 [Symmachiella dynata]|uniref:hypothetical protein n=1 Tax=Symmachiella dynata TaxID=2527995 RepID=UPI001189EDD7|nr:hypothetical protein [Symmachiella dynata]QDT51766.1 hypothetical protein Pan258_58580 [Symmachiella dynata]